MKVTRAGEYAIRCIFFMAKQEEGRVISLNEIAEAMEIPKQFLSKIVQQLSRSGIIKIYQGPKGGCRLLVAPENLSLLDVVETIMGEIVLHDYDLGSEPYQKQVAGAAQPVWKKAESQLRQTLREATFDKLVSGIVVDSQRLS